MRHRVKQGRLQYLWEPVYLVGTPPAEPPALARGATLAVDGFVSHDWCGFVHGFAEPPRLPVDVLVTSGSRDGRPGNVRVHRSEILEPHDLGNIGDIPV